MINITNKTKQKSVRLSYGEAVILFMHRLQVKEVTYTSAAAATSFCLKQDKLTWYPARQTTYSAVLGVPGWYSDANAFINRDKLYSLHRKEPL